MSDQTTSNIIKYFKVNRNKRGLDYFQQFDNVTIDVDEDYLVRIREVFYVHTEFYTLHNREMIHFNQKLIDSHYY